MSQQRHEINDPAVEEMSKALEIAKSSGASPKLIQTIQSALDLAELREGFALHATSKESAGLRRIMDETYTHDWETVHKEGKSEWNCFPEMVTGHLEGQFLKSLVSMHQAKRILDIGMFTGYSALAMAEALPADGEVLSIEMAEYLKTVVTDWLKDSPHFNKIKIVIGRACDVLKDLANAGEKFDIIFMDADKEEYLDYMMFAFEGSLLNNGGTLIVDNVFLYGAGYKPNCGNNCTKVFADAVSSDPTLHSVLVPIRDGVLIIRRLSDVEGSTK